MKINTSNNITSINLLHQKNNNNHTNLITKFDSFEHSNINNKQNTNVTFKGGFFSKIFHKEEVPKPPITIAKDQYRRTIQIGIKEFFDKDISAENLDFIITPEEFKEILPTLKFENFDVKNAKSSNPDKIYCADLATETNFGRSETNLFALLDKVAETADKYNQKTGKKFLFSITDIDRVDANKHAIELMASNPEKYKNVRFVPGVKMSFTHKVPSEYGKAEFPISEIAVIGINPFSKKINESLKEIGEKRKEVSREFTLELRAKYPLLNCSFNELLSNNNIYYIGTYNVPNLYQKVIEYVEAKSYRGDMLDYNEFNGILQDLFSKYSTREELDKDGNPIIVAPLENTIETIMDTFSEEDTKPVMAIGAPYYLSRYFQDDDTSTYNGVISFIKDLKEKTDGMLVAFESKAPAYKLDEELYRKVSFRDFPNETVAEITKDYKRLLTFKEQPALKKFNDFLRNNKEIKLYEIGGSMYDTYMEKYSISS